MRILILILIALLAFGCSSKKAVVEKAQAITKFGIITAKEEVDMEAVEKESRVRTSVYASVSSGGGVSIGLGFLLSPFFSSESEEDAVRYQVEFLDEGEITIYHLSHQFEVDDCVEITVYPNEDENPPTMVRSKDGCSG